MAQIDTLTLVSGVDNVYNVRIMEDNLIPNTGQGVPGAGRKAGGHNEQPRDVLPPIELESLPFKVYTGRQSLSKIHSYTAPRMLHYMFTRCNMFIVYADQGYNDPVGEMCFKLLGKEVVKHMIKDLGTPSPLDDASRQASEAEQARAWLNALKEQRAGIVDDAELIAPRQQLDPTPLAKARAAAANRRKHDVTGLTIPGITRTHSQV